MFIIHAVTRGEVITRRKVIHALEICTLVKISIASTNLYNPHHHFPCTIRDSVNYSQGGETLQSICTVRRDEQVHRSITQKRRCQLWKNRNWSVAAPTAITGFTRPLEGTRITGVPIQLHPNATYTHATITAIIPFALASTSPTDLSPTPPHTPPIISNTPNSHIQTRITPTASSSPPQPQLTPTQQNLTLQSQRSGLF